MDAETSPVALDESGDRLAVLELSRRMFRPMLGPQFAACVTDRGCADVSGFIAHRLQRHAAYTERARLPNYLANGRARFVRDDRLRCHSLWCLEWLRDQLEISIAADDGPPFVAAFTRVRFARLMIDVHWRSRFEYAGREWRARRAAERARSGAQRGDEVPAPDLDE